MPEAIWKKLKASNLKKITRRKSRKNRSFKKKGKQSRVRKQRGGDSNLIPFGDKGGVPTGLGGTVTTMSDEGVPLTKSFNNDDNDDNGDNNNDDNGDNNNDNYENNNNDE
jgi:hypothetical protein